MWALHMRLLYKLKVSGDTLSIIRHFSHESINQFFKQMKLHIQERLCQKQKEQGSHANYFNTLISKHFITITYISSFFP